MFAVYNLRVTTTLLEWETNQNQLGNFRRFANEGLSPTEAQRLPDFLVNFFSEAQASESDQVENCDQNFCEAFKNLVNQSSEWFQDAIVAK